MRRNPVLDHRRSRLGHPVVAEQPEGAFRVLGVRRISVDGRVDEIRARIRQAAPFVQEITDVVGLLLFTHDAGRKPVFRAPNRLRAVTVGLHQRVDRIELIQRRIRMCIQTRRERHRILVRMERKCIEVALRARGVHLRHEVDRVERPAADADGRPEDPSDHRRLRICRLDGGVGRLEKCGVTNRVGTGGRAVGERRVGLVPHLVRPDLARVTSRQSRHELGVVRRVIGRRIEIRVLPAGPGRRRVDHPEDSHAPRVGGPHHVVDERPVKGSVGRLDGCPRDRDADVGDPERLQFIEVLVDRGRITRGQVEVVVGYPDGVR